MSTLFCFPSKAIAVITFHSIQVLLSIIVITTIWLDGYFISQSTEVDDTHQCIFYAYSSNPKLAGVILGNSGSCSFSLFGNLIAIILAIVPLFYDGISLLDGGERKEKVAKYMRMLSPACNLLTFATSVMISTGLTSTCLWNFSDNCYAGYKTLGSNYASLEFAMIASWLLWGSWFCYMINEFRERFKVYKRNREFIPIPEETHIHMSSIQAPSKIFDGIGEQVQASVKIQNEVVQAAPESKKMENPFMTSDRNFY